jgi:hypothetical protein
MKRKKIFYASRSEAYFGEIRFMTSRKRDLQRLATGQGSLEVSAWVRWFIEKVSLAIQASIAHVEAAFLKTQFWQEVMFARPALSPAQRKVLDKLFEQGVAYRQACPSQVMRVFRF